MVNQVSHYANQSCDMLIQSEPRKFHTDTLKGSYYANPVLDEPSVSPILREAYPEYYGKNICRLFALRFYVHLFYTFGP